MSEPACSNPSVTSKATERAAAELLGRMIFAFSRLDMALGLCIVWTGGGRNIESLSAAMQTPDGMTYVARPKEGAGIEIVGRPNSHWVDPARAEGPTLRERYWSPTVLVRGSIAVVWAPYEFWEDGKSSHCGVDVFDLVKIDGEWRVSNSMWTVEPDACAGLRPADTSQLHPEG